MAFAALEIFLTIQSHKVTLFVILIFGSGKANSRASAHVRTHTRIETQVHMCTHTQGRAILGH